MSFRPPLWATIVALAGLLLFANLANWQFQRGQEKTDIIARRADMSNASVFKVQAASEIPQAGQRLELTGLWDAERQILLDNQTQNTRIGVHVWTPLRLLNSDRVFLVNRGWLAASLYRDQMPDTGSLPAGIVTVTGFWRALPKAGLATDSGDCGVDTNWPQRLNYPSFALLDCLYEGRAADGLLLLDPDRPDGFSRRWTDLGVPPERHYGYAVQWAALALTTLILFLVLNLKRKTSQ